MAVSMAVDTVSMAVDTALSANHASSNLGQNVKT